MKYLRPFLDTCLELVSKELNHFLAILNVYAGGEGGDFYEVKKKLLLFFKKQALQA